MFVIPCQLLLDKSIADLRLRVALIVLRINIWSVLSFLFYNKFLKKSRLYVLPSYEIAKFQKRFKPYYIAFWHGYYYKFGNKWIVNYDQLLPHFKKINRRESKLWKAYMARIGIKKSVTPRKKWLKKWPAWDDSNVRQTRLRRPVLYPAELQADMINHSTFWKIFQITFYAETISKTIPDIV